MRYSMDARQFQKDMNNLVEYSFGYLEGIDRGKKVFLQNFGKDVIFALGQYVDSNARMNPEALHHVYEWYRTGSPEARLYDLDYTVNNLGLSISSTFRQSSTLKDDMREPFYNKARIMEDGIAVTITPKPGGALKFTDGGGEVFTRRPVTVRDPGGAEVKGSFERTIDTFFRFYFTQAFLRASGLFTYISNPTLYKANLRKGKLKGRSEGIKTGYTWITNAKIGVD